MQYDFLVAREIPSMDEIVHQHSRAVVAFARSMVRSPELIDDIVQETFIRVWRYLPSYRGDGSFEGWVIRICRNVTLTMLKKQPSFEGFPPECARRDDPFEQSDLVALIDSLHVEHRTVATLCLVLGYSYEEAAEILEVPVGTIRSRLSRARDTLRTLVGEPHETRRGERSA